MNSADSQRTEKTMKRYRSDVLFESDMDEDDFAMWLEDVLYSVSTKTSAVVDLCVYEVRHLPSFAEQARELIRAQRDR